MARRTGFTGKVKKLTVSGIDRNSAMLEIVLVGANKKAETFLVVSQPPDHAISKSMSDLGHERQVFAAYATLFTSAYALGASVAVTYVVRDKANWISSAQVS